MHLSPHFTLEELIASDVAARFGIDNTPPPEALERLEELCTVLLEPIRAKFGAVHVNSGYRCLDLNRLLRSKDTSQHVLGEAADIIVLADSRPLALCRWVAASGLPFNQVIHEYGRWTHGSIARVGQPPKREALTIDLKGTRVGLFEART